MDIVAHSPEAPPLGAPELGEVPYCVDEAGTEYSLPPITRLIETWSHGRFYVAIGVSDLDVSEPFAVVVAELPGTLGRWRVIQGVTAMIPRPDRVAA